MDYAIPVVAIAILALLAYLIYKDLKKRHSKRNLY